MGDYTEVFIGLDVAKLKNAVAIAEAGRSGEVRYLGEIDPRGVSLGWAGLVLSFLISILGAISIRTTSQRPVFLLLLCALTGVVISETLVSLCMASAFFSGLLATGGRFSMPLPSFGKEGSVPVSPVAIDQ